MNYYFSKLVDRYFNQWIGKSTWNSMHPLDMVRFYKFLKAFNRYSRNLSLSRIRKNIFKAAKDKHPKLSDEQIEKSADRFTQQARIIFEYLAAPFPDPLVEMRNPYEVSLYLRTLRIWDESGKSRDLYTSDEIEKKLIDNFGEGWREQSKYK